MGEPCQALLVVDEQARLRVAIEPGRSDEPPSAGTKVRGRGNFIGDVAFPVASKAVGEKMSMRWWWIVLLLPVCQGAGTDPGARLPMEVGVLSCTLARSPDPQMSAQSATASEAREMQCTF